MKLGKAISWLLIGLQRTLFPQLEDCWKKPLTDKEQQLVSILEILKIERHIADTARNQRMGRKMSERETIARSFVAKAVYGFRTTRGLLEALSTTPNLRRICGFERVSDIPSESTFSRAFATFAKSGLGEKVHKALVEEHLKAELIGHISRDSTAIEGREKPVKKEPKKRAAPRKRGRPAKGEPREPKEQKRLERQKEQSAEEALKELPTSCDVGTKKNSKGFKESWIGYKLHADVNDCGLPISIAVTAASVHDSQVAIPLMKMSSAKVTYLYDVMDAAYDAGAIYEVSKSLGHVPLIDKNSRGKEVVPMAPHEALRYNERTVVERFNSRMKEDFGAGNVMVRGAQKVKMHLMFAIMALFADQLIKLTT
jgi:IS5 family transposase